MLESWRKRLSWHFGPVAVLLIFVVAGVVRYRHESGEDLSSSYVGCRLIATGNPGVLYTFDSDNFASVGDRTGTWQRMAAQGKYSGYLHPYVQTPLWAFLLQPLCDHTRFLTFERVFLVLILLALAGAVFLIARYWTPWLYGTVGLMLVLLAWWFSEPFRYAMFLMQTHALFFFLTIAALILAERQRPVGAGFLMACAAAVKITPGILLIYWLLTRRWKAAGSLAVWSLVLLAVSYAAVGRHLMGMYFADLHRLSRVLLVAQNNQSLAAWWMGRFYGPDEVFDITIWRLPTAVRIVSTLLTLGCTAAGGWLDRRRGAGLPGGAMRPPAGAMIALVATTIFAPIAWTHYSIILVAPVMVLIEESRRLRSWWLAALVAVVAVLNFPPLATDVLRMDIGRGSIVRGQFFAGALCMVGLAIAGWSDRGPWLDEGRMQPA